MTDTTTTPPNPDDIPFPLLEQGDVVRLKEPYQLAPSRHLATAVEATADALATAQIHPDELPDYLDTADALHYTQYENLDSAPPVRTFTHGIIAEVATRYPAQRFDLPEARIVEYTNIGGSPPRNVALFLFNPETGLLLLDRGAGETGRPTFVDFHVQELVLIQKHNEAYSHREIDIKAVYDTWGITDIVDTITDGDDAETDVSQPPISPAGGPAASSSDAWLGIDPDTLIESLVAEVQERRRTENSSLADAIGDTLEAHRIDIWYDLSFVEQMALADQLTDTYDLGGTFDGEQASKAPYGTDDWREAVVTGYLWHILDGAIRAVIDIDDASVDDL